MSLNYIPTSHRKMKPFQISLLPFLIIIIIPSSSSAAPKPFPVLDTDGHPLQSNLKYNILPVIRDQTTSNNNGGGLTLSFTGRINTTIPNCPLDVVQSKSDIDNGLPVTLSPNNKYSKRVAVIRESTDLNFKFLGVHRATGCVESTVWKLGGFDEGTKRYFVTTGGLEGKPGMETVSNWFKIEKINKVFYYKLVFCPMVCKFCKVICKDVGIYRDGNGFRRLVLTDDVPFVVMFNKTSKSN